MVVRLEEKAEGREYDDGKDGDDDTIESQRRAPLRRCQGRRDTYQDHACMAPTRGFMMAAGWGWATQLLRYQVDGVFRVFGTATWSWVLADARCLRRRRGFSCDDVDGAAQQGTRTGQSPQVCCLRFRACISGSIYRGLGSTITTPATPAREPMKTPVPLQHLFSCGEPSGTFSETLSNYLFHSTSREALV